MDARSLEPFQAFLKSLPAEPDCTVAGCSFVLYTDEEQLQDMLLATQDASWNTPQAQFVPAEGTPQVPPLDLMDLTALFQLHQHFTQRPGLHAVVFNPDPMLLDDLFFHLNVLTWIRQQARLYRDPPLSFLIFLPRTLLIALLNSKLGYYSFVAGRSIPVYDDLFQQVVQLGQLLDHRVMIMERREQGLNVHRRHLLMKHHLQPQNRGPEVLQLLRSLYVLTHEENPVPATDRLPLLTEVLSTLWPLEHELAQQVLNAFLRFEFLQWRALVSTHDFTLVIEHLFGLPDLLNHTEALQDGLSPLRDISTEMIPLQDPEVDHFVLKLRLQDFLELRGQASREQIESQWPFLETDAARALLHRFSLTSVSGWPALFEQSADVLDALKDTVELLPLFTCQYAVLGEQQEFSRLLELPNGEEDEDDLLQQARLICLYFGVPVPTEIEQNLSVEKLLQPPPGRRTTNWLSAEGILEVLLTVPTTREDRQRIKLRLQEQLQERGQRKMESAAQQVERHPDRPAYQGIYGGIHYGLQKVHLMYSVLELLNGNVQLSLQHLTDTVELQLAYMERYYNYKYTFSQKIQLRHLLDHHLFLLNLAASAGVQVHPLTRSWVHELLEQVQPVTGHLSAMGTSRAQGGFVDVFSLLGRVRERWANTAGVESCLPEG